jgi:hypothetical protein
MIKTALILSALLMTFTALSCDPPSGSHPPAVFTLTYHANNADGGTVPAVASDGSLWISGDSGVTWQECTATVPRQWRSVTLADESGFVAAVASGTQGVFVWK